VLILRDEQANAAAVISRVNGLLAEHQQLRRWFIWRGEDFPRTATQKVRKEVVGAVVRADLAKAALQSARAEISALDPANDLTEIITRLGGEAAGSLDRSARLGADLKLDSLARVELLSAIEDRYQIEVDEAALTDATTLDEVEKLIREGAPERMAPYPYPKWQRRWPLNWLRIVLFYLVIWPFTQFLGWPRIRGREHLRGVVGPIAFICNHITMTDHALVLFALPARFRARMAIAMEGERLRDWLHPAEGTRWPTRLRSLLTYVSVVLLFNVFSMPRKSGFRRSFRFAGEAMDQGFNVMVFPEGERTAHGAMNAFRPGAGLLVSKLAAPVVPLRIDGLWELKVAGRHFARPGEVTVTIGKPLQYPRQADPEVITKDLMEHVRTL